MKRLTPLLTLLSGAVTAAVLFTMSAQAAPPAPPAAETGPPATAPSTEGLGDAPADPDPAGTRPAATSPPASPEARSGGAEATVEQNWTGRLENGATIAITVAADGKAEAYVCDGRKMELWLSGTVTDGRIELTGRDAKLTGAIRGNSASGEMIVGVRRWKFTAKPTGSTAPAVYRATADVRDAGVDGGWIVLPDGTQIGIVTWNGTPVPAPPLDPAFWSTVVDDVTITAAPVVPGAR
ncbi:hypothetical protein GA0070616_0181 [Micromonospora nigra]|uniref:Serine/threonine protein kinase n=1 Tax=Micromonospora nigra TaxID=145857 RepID=A0A1C6R8Z1_9ACTN|nr:hypothetical protein [Micromonospora nigra]SCL13566.1 hypothetical protein GA0070616_0181 [Micromonospora nigra]